MRSSAIRTKEKKKRKKVEAIINIRMAILDVAVPRGTWPESVALHAEGKGLVKSISRTPRNFGGKGGRPFCAGGLHGST